MNQPALRILCAYHDEESRYLDKDPEDELQEHQVTIVHTYAEAKRMILDGTRGIPPFDIVLSDVSLPGGIFEEDRFDSFPFCPILLQPYLDHALVRGLGIFVPEHFETTFDHADGFSAVVATKDCFTLQNGRDWRRLFELVTASCEGRP